jgi:hypothetical protein
MSGRGARTRKVLLAAAFAAVAVALSVLVPSEEFQQRPYVLQAPELGARVDARMFSVTVLDTRLADRVQTPEWTGDTPGVWLVVDIEFERTLERGSITGSFRIGDTEYLLSARPDLASIDGGGASSMPGLPWTGSMLVELPLSALEDPAAGAAVIRFAVSADPRLDGVVDYTIDLGSIDRESSVTLFEPERAPA